MSGLHLNLLICLITVAVLDKEKVFLMDNGKCIYFPFQSRRRSGVVLDNEKVFLMDNVKCIYFSSHVFFVRTRKKKNALNQSKLGISFFPPMALFFFWRHTSQKLEESHLVILN